MLQYGSDQLPIGLLFNISVSVIDILAEKVKAIVCSRTNIFDVFILMKIAEYDDTATIYIYIYA